MPALPRIFREAVFALETDEDLITLITISKPAWDSPIRISTHASERFSDDPLRDGTTSNGVEYDFAVTKTVRPDDVEDALPAFPIVIENVAQDLASLLDEDLSDVTVSSVRVLKSDPDTVVEVNTDFQVQNVSCAGEAIALACSLDPIEHERSPAYQFTPYYFPGLVR